MEDVFTEHGFSTGLNTTIKEANQLGERVFVFFENNFPWKVWVEGDILKSAPFFEGELNKLWRAFPFNRTNSEDINVRNMVFRKAENKFFKYRDEDEKLQLKILSVDIERDSDEGTCEIYLDYENKRSGDYVDHDFASCLKYKGKPICFSVGRRALTVRGLNVSEWEIDDKEVPSIGEDNLAVAIAKKINPRLNPIPPEPTVEDVSAVDRNEVVTIEGTLRLPVNASVLNVFKITGAGAGTFFSFRNRDESISWSYRYYSSQFLTLSQFIVTYYFTRPSRDVGNIRTLNESVSSTKIQKITITGTGGLDIFLMLILLRIIKFLFNL